MFDRDARDHADDDQVVETAALHAAYGALFADFRQAVNRAAVERPDLALFGPTGVARDDGGLLWCLAEVRRRGPDGTIGDAVEVARIPLLLPVVDQVAELLRAADRLQPLEAEEAPPAPDFSLN